MAEDARAALVVGAGASRGLGAALARRFAREGLHVLVCGRTRERIEALAGEIEAGGGRATPLVCDATREADLVSAVETACAGGRELEVAVYNAGNMRVGNLLEMSAADFEATWRVTCLGGFLLGREAGRRMAERGRGTLLFTGATASLRARPPFAGFAAAKAGLRAVAFGLARELGPRGVHVAHVVIDGVIDGEQVRSRAPDIAERMGPDGLLDPEAIAAAYWQVHRQPRSAWTAELDLRPFKESF